MPGDEADLVKTPSVIGGFSFTRDVNVLDLKYIEMSNLVLINAYWLVNSIVEILKLEDSRHAAKVQESNTLKIKSRP